MRRLSVTFISIVLIFLLQLRGVYGSECDPDIQSKMDAKAYENLFIEWRQQALDESVKERARVTKICLKRANVASNTTEILNWLLEPAKLGVNESILQLGMFSIMAAHEETDDDKSFNRAVQLLFPLAINGDSEASYLLGFILLFDEESSISSTIALEFLNFASQSGSIEAREILANQSNITR